MKVPVRFIEPESHDSELTNADRCDRCGAQAFALAVVNSVTLLFCGHHFAKHVDRLIFVASRIRDERALINCKPSPSANNDDPQKEAA